MIRACVVIPWSIITFGNTRVKKICGFFWLNNLNGWWFLVTWGCDVCMMRCFFHRLKEHQERVLKSDENLYLSKLLLGSNFPFEVFFPPFFTPWHNTFEKEIQQELWDSCLFITLGGYNTFIEEGKYDFFYMDLIS